MRIARFAPLALTVGWLCSAPAAQAASPVVVTSPNGQLAITLEMKSNPQPYRLGNRLYYRVSYKGQPVLADSPLGIEFKGAPPLDHDFRMTGVERRSGNRTWHWAFGAESTIRNHYRQAIVFLRELEPPHRRLEIVLRAYDTGVAFRYTLPQQAALGKFTIANEETGFYFARPATAFALDLGRFNSNYESEFRHIPLSKILPESVVGLPLTAHLNGGPWVALLEADLTDYAGLYVGGAPGVPDGLQARLSPLPNHLDEAVVGQTPKTTPWRILLMAPQAGGLIESSEPMVLNLSAPTAIGDTSWIHPGKAAWDWWSGDYARGVNFKPGMNTATLKHYIAFAARAHLPYMLIDAGWSPAVDGVCSAIKPDSSAVPSRGWCVHNDITRWVPRVNLPALLQYAKASNVKILLWIHWTAAAEQMDQAFPLYEKWGVAGVKVDFMDNVPDDQTTVNLYQKLVSTAARYHLIIDIHGAYKPTGLRRAYPNLLNREGVMGLEYDKWSYRETPRHDVTLPFTRMLAGPMDYTPGCFNNATRAAFRPRNVQPMCQGTRASQLAMYVVYLAPLEMLADYPEDYLGQPGFQFLEKVPTVWDETRVLDGEPGRYVTIARRHGDRWYLGSMTNWHPRQLDVPLNFLGPGRYRATLFLDGPRANQDAKSLTIRKQTVTPADTLHLELASGGGAAAIFTPLR